MSGLDTLNREAFERLLHESGHAVACEHYGITWALLPSGDRIAHGDVDAFKDAVIAICGPMLEGLAINHDHRWFNQRGADEDIHYWMRLPGESRSACWPYDSTPRGEAFKEARRICEHRINQALELTLMWYAQGR